MPVAYEIYAVEGSMPCVEAARAGDLPALQRLRQQHPPCPWDINTCSVAARNGHLETLQWLRQQQPPCPWNVNTCSVAAEGGHLETLQWLRQQHPPCPWGTISCVLAAECGHLDTLHWLRQQQPPCPLWQDALHHVEFKDHILLYLGQIGAPFTPEQRTRLLQLRDRSVFIYMLLLKYLPIEVPHEVVRDIVYLSIQ